MSNLSKDRRVWKWYLAALVILTLGTMFAGVFTLWDLLIGLPVSALALVPLYGFAWQRRIDPRWLWIVVLVFNVVFVGGVFALGLAGLFFGEVTEGFTAWWLGWLVFIAPYLYAVHQYAFNSSHLWAAHA